MTPCPMHWGSNRVAKLLSDVGMPSVKFPTSLLLDSSHPQRRAWKLPLTTFSIWYQISAKWPYYMSWWGCTGISVPRCGVLQRLWPLLSGESGPEEGANALRAETEEHSSKGTAGTPALCWERAGRAWLLAEGQWGREAVGLKEVGAEAAEREGPWLLRFLDFPPEEQAWIKSPFRAAKWRGLENGRGCQETGWESLVRAT